MRRLWRKFKRLFKKPVYKTPVETTPIPATGSDAERLAEMYKRCKVTRNSTVDWCMNQVNKNRDIYDNIENKTGVPWYVVACIDNLEASFIHTRALHNGDKIIGTGKKTYRVPKNRGPFATWEESAIDALGMKKGLYPAVWSIGASLDFLEHYNGLGYRKYHQDVNSPYLWSMSNMYSKGKYVSDGKWSSSAVSKQVGAVVIMKLLGV